MRRVVFPESFCPIKRPWCLCYSRSATIIALRSRTCKQTSLQLLSESISTLVFTAVLFAVEYDDYILICFAKSLHVSRLLLKATITNPLRICRN